MVRLSFALFAVVIMIAALTGAGAALAAPALMNLTADNQLQFTSTGFNTPHDINTVDQAGALRFFGCPSLTNPPNCAAIQFYGNDANLFGGQVFIDSAANTNAAIILRTAQSGQGVAERMRVSSNGNVGIGTQNPQSALQVVGNYIQIPTLQNGPVDAPPPLADCDEDAEIGRMIVHVLSGTNNYFTKLWICARSGPKGGPPAVWIAFTP